MRPKRIQKTLTSELFLILCPQNRGRFINSVSHGANLQSLEIGNGQFIFGEFLIGLIYLTLYTMIAGYIYGAIKNFLLRGKSE